MIVSINEDYQTTSLFHSIYDEFLSLIENGRHFANSLQQLVPDLSQTLHIGVLAQNKPIQHIFIEPAL